MRKRQFTEQQLRELSLSVIERVLSHPRVLAAKTILFYYSLPDEVFTHEAIDTLVSAGKRVLLPVVLPDNEMELRLYHSPNDMSEDQFHIKEPCGATFSALDTIDVALVPGMSFDDQGHRLGRGKGYYDRFLKNFRGTSVGLCYSSYVKFKLPRGDYDMPVDKIATERYLRSTHP